MKRFLLAAMSVVAAAASAQAADMPVKAPPPVAAAIYSWTGFYIGGNAGYAWGRSNATSVFSCPAGGGCAYNSPVSFAAFGAGASGRSLADRVIAGVQAGYNWQSGRMVFGVEQDLSYFRLRGGRSTTGQTPLNPALNYTSTQTFGTNVLFTFRGRLGVTVTPTALLYATGGLAVTDLKVSNFFTDTAGAISIGASSNTVIKAGWVAGGGLELALGGKWTAKGEYHYVKFGSVNTTLTTTLGGAANPNQMSTTADLRAHIARLGLNYRLN